MIKLNAEQVEDVCHNLRNCMTPLVYVLSKLPKNEDRAIMETSVSRMLQYLKDLERYNEKFNEENDRS